MFKLNLKAIPFKKILWGFLILGGIFGFFVGGYLGAYYGEDFVQSLQEPKIDLPTVQVYKSKTYLLGLRYPLDWGFKEISANLVIFSPVIPEGGTPVAEYIDLLVVGSGSRAKTPCEKDATVCTLVVNNIAGDLTSTPEKEIAFFSKEKRDFTFTLYKYGGQDYQDIFEAMVKSLRFTAAPQTAEVGGINE